TRTTASPVPSSVTPVLNRRVKRTQGLPETNSPKACATHGIRFSQSPKRAGLKTRDFAYQGNSSEPSCGQVRPAVRNQVSVPIAPDVAAAAVGAEITRSSAVDRSEE